MDDHDDLGGKAKMRSTIDVYSSLVQLEVKAITTRLADMSAELVSFSECFGSVMLELEALSSRLDAVKTGLEFCRSELAGIKKMLVTYEQRLSAMQVLVDREKRLL